MHVCKGYHSACLQNVYAPGDSTSEASQFGMVCTCTCCAAVAQRMRYMNRSHKQAASIQLIRPLRWRSQGLAQSISGRLTDTCHERNLSHMTFHECSQQNLGSRARMMQQRGPTSRFWYKETHFSTSCRAAVRSRVLGARSEVAKGLIDLGHQSIRAWSPTALLTRPYSG